MEGTLWFLPVHGLLNGSNFHLRNGLAQVRYSFAVTKKVGAMIEIIIPVVLYYLFY